MIVSGPLSGLTHSSRGTAKKQWIIFQLSPAERWREAVERGEPGGKPPSAKTYSDNETYYAWIDSKVTPRPNGVFVQPIKLTGKLEQIAKKTYVRMPRFPHAAFDKALAECKADSTWHTFIDDSSGHDVMIDQPEWLADLLPKAS
jgi:hypothetical protein